MKEQRYAMNSNAIRAGAVPCETNPETGGLSRTLEAFHAVASLTVGQRKGEKRHVCEPCANKFHHLQQQARGIVWDGGAR